MKHLAPFMFILLYTLCFTSSCDNEDENPFYNGNVVLVTQADVNEFARQGTMVISGDLTIGMRLNPETSDLNDLSMLSRLVRVRGDLKILETALVDLQGLENLRGIEGDLHISSNDELTSITQLSGMEEINGILTFDHNPLVTDLSAFDGLAGINDLRVSQNTGLESLFDMSNVQDLARFYINGNNGLRSLNGPSPARIESLWISHNHVLNDLKGLENTTQINRLVIQANNRLRSVEGLDNLSSLTDSLVLRSNPELIDLNGMGYLQTGPEYLSVHSNPKLESIDRFRMRSDSRPALAWITGNTELSGLEPLKGLEKIQGLSSILNGQIEDLSDLSDLKEAEFLEIGAQFNLVDLRGLEQLESLRSFYLSGNQELVNLDALSGLKQVSQFEIKRNPKLTDLCGIRPVVLAGGVTELDVEENAFNPSMKDLVDGNCNN